jgi:sugar phosphate permease
MRLAGRLADRFVPRNVFYGWYIAAAGACSGFLLVGITAFGFGFFISRFREEFGWSVQAIGLGVSIRSLEQGMLSPFMGNIMDRLGARRAALTGITIIAASLFLFSRANTLPLYYTASIVMAVGQSLGGYSAFSLAAMNWFSKKRGRAMGVMNIGNGAAYAMPLIIAAISSALGFRTALVILGVAVLVVGIPLAMVIRDRPESVGLLPDGDRPPVGYAAPPDGNGRAAAGPSRTGSGLSVSEVLRIPAFYLLLLTSVSIGAGMNAWVTFQIPALEADGFSLKAAGLMTLVYGLVQIPMRFVIGWAGDTMGRRRLYMATCVLFPIGLMIFAFLSPSRLWLLPAYYLTFALGHAGWVIGSSTLAADYFGTRRLATIRGLNQSLQVPMSVAVPIFAGGVFDRYGSYQWAFLILGLLGCTALLWFSLVRRPLWAEASKAAAS